MTEEEVNKFAFMHIVAREQKRDFPDGTRDSLKTNTFFGHVCSKNVWDDPSKYNEMINKWVCFL